MPLTFAHPAAALPFARLRLPLSALVVGAMAPDLIYFIRLAPRGHFGHTALGLFVFCLPAGLVLWWIFHRILKPALVELCPDAAQRRLVAYRKPVVVGEALLPAAVAVVLGALTHIIWDAFTHAGGWGVAAVPALSTSVSFSPGPAIPAYKIAQHASTLFGLGALALALAGWWRTAPQHRIRPRLSARVRLIRLAGLVLIALGAGFVYATTLAVGAQDPLRAFAGRFVVSVTSAAFVVATAYSLWVRIQTPRAERPRGQTTSIDS